MLLIKSVRPSDADVYVCEVNSDPALRSFHPLRGEWFRGVSVDREASSNYNLYSIYKSNNDKIGQRHCRGRNPFVLPPHLTSFHLLPPLQSRPYLVQRRAVLAPPVILTTISQQKVAPMAVVVVA